MRNTYTAVTPAEYRRHRGRARRGLEICQDVILFGMNAGGRPATNLGTVNDRAQRGGTARSLHAVGRAGDVGVANFADGLFLFTALIAAADSIGLDEAIFAGQRWDATSRRTKRYHGINQHRDHVHYALDVKIADSDIPTDVLAKWFAGNIFKR